MTKYYCQIKVFSLEFITSHHTEAINEFTRNKELQRQCICKNKSIRGEWDRSCHHMKGVPASLIGKLEESLYSSPLSLSSVFTDQNG